MQTTAKTEVAWVPDLLKGHPRLAQLYRAVVDHPLEDDPRLRFADACQEAAEDDPGCDPAIPAWAEFVSLQFKLHRLGKARHKIESTDFECRGGPDYFRCLVPDTCPAAVGDRVDVRPYPGNPHVRKMFRLRPDYPGLLVRRVEPYDVLHRVLVLKEDADSKPFPADEYGTLAQDCDRLLREHEAKWLNPGFVSGLVGTHLTAGDVGPRGPARFLAWVAERGFCSRMRLAWRHRNYVEASAALYPISDVHFTEVPSMQWEPVYQGYRWWLPDADPQIVTPRLPDWVQGQYAATPEYVAGYRSQCQALLDMMYPGRRVRVREGADLML